MPTKALLQSAEVRHGAGRAAEFGVRVGKVGVDFGRVMARKDRLIGEFADYRRGQLTDGRFDLVRSRARFVDAHTVETSEGKRLTGRFFMIATGSRSSAPAVPGLEEVGYWTSDDVLKLRRLPKSLIVLGGGAVALEFAQFFQRMGTRVSLVQRGEHVLRSADPDVAQALEGALRAEGIRLHTGTALVEVRQTGREKEVRFTQGGKAKRVKAEALLVALGRAPETASLNLAAAGVKTTDQGRIETDAGMRTSVPHIYAGGDCTSRHEIVHLAVLQGEVAGHNIANPRKGREMDDRLLIQVVFTEPQLASVGLTEAEAARQGVACLAAQYPFNDHGKSLILGATAGFVKLLASPRTGEILGGSCVGPMGGELIHEIVAAMSKRMTAAELAAMPHYHPTLAEIWTYPAEELAEKVRLRRRPG